MLYNKASYTTLSNCVQYSNCEHPDENQPVGYSDISVKDSEWCQFRSSHPTWST